MEHYKNAICRQPSRSCGAGETSVDLGQPDVDLLLKQHQVYVDQLIEIGLDVTVLPALSEFPDSYFTEDVAIVTPEIAIVTRPGAQSRRNETQYIESSLARHRNIQHIIEPGTLDGGDVLIVNQHCVVGLSERTNLHGAEQLSSILAQYDYHTDIVEVSEALHLKSNVNFIDERTLLVTPSCYDLDCLSAYRKLVVPEEEAYAANVVWMNDTIWLPEGFPISHRLLQENGYDTVLMPVSEIAKMDGGLTCLSLRIT